MMLYQSDNLCITPNHLTVTQGEFVFTSLYATFEVDTVQYQNFVFQEAR